MSKVEIVKHGTQDNIDRYEEEHHPKITYICNRCGCVWKCRHEDNNFSRAHGSYENPDVICQECDSTDVTINKKNLWNVGIWIVLFGGVEFAQLDIQVLDTMGFVLNL